MSKTLQSQLDHVHDLLDAGLVREAKAAFKKIKAPKSQPGPALSRAELAHAAAAARLRAPQVPRPNPKAPAKRGRRKVARPQVGVGIPPKKKGESWPKYHDRLVADALAADNSGNTALSNALYARAGRIAHLRKRVRDAPRSGKRRGPGSYPWSECIAQTQTRMKAKGYPDYRERAKKVCGAIRARSQRTYPAYWKARDPGRALPGRKNPGSRGLTPQQLRTDTGGPWHDHKGFQYVAAIEVQEQIVAIVREKPGKRGSVLGGDVLIARGFASPAQAESDARAKIDELAKMAGRTKAA